MSDRDRKRLREIHTFPALVKYLREDLGWPVEQGNFADLDEITFDWEADELGIDPDQAAKIEYIKQLRPLENGEPQGVFFVKFNAKSLPVVALRRLLSKLVIKKRATATAAERPLWAMRDLVFISSYGSSEERQLSFAYFQESEQKTELPTLKVLGWDDRDTALHLDRVHDLLTSHLTWPANSRLLPHWRKDWSKAFELRHGQVVSTAKELAVQLAALARGIRERANQLLKLETEKGPLRALMAGFKAALIHDLTEDQFADMYAQTIAYGLLSARITHPDAVQAETLPDLIPVTNPFLKELMETFVLAGGKQRTRRKGVHLDFDELGINDVIELLRRANMDAVLRNFGADDRKEDPVTYFYEDFLNAYDAQERKRRGVYYTPKPVVNYIVRRVHEVLKMEFGIEDGLASIITWDEMAGSRASLKIPANVEGHTPFVQILDPATGTATFLVTAIEVIFETLTARWRKEGLSEVNRSEAWNTYVPQHLLPRLYGYELMMAPYAIAHLKIGLKLFETGYRFGSEERARIYLTNALEPASDASFSQTDALSNALAHEASAVSAVKKTRRFTLIVGNPPYSRHSSNPNKDSTGRFTYIGRLVEEYKDGCPELRKPAQAKYLQDDYVKFLRLCEQLITDAGTGVLGLITNHGFIDNPTFRGLRAHLLSCCPSLEILDLHGNANKKERSPDGSDDKNVFDIKQGVAILCGRRVPSDDPLVVKYGELWGNRESKYKALINSHERELVATSVDPKAPQYLLCPTDQANDAEYAGFEGVRDIFSPIGDPAPGIVTTQDSFAVAFTRDQMVSNVETLLSTSSEHEAREHFRLCTQSQWDYKKAKRELSDGKWRNKIIPLYYRPFDRRYTVYDSNVAVHRRERVTRHLIGGHNIALLTSRMTKGESFKHAQVTRLVPEVICMSPMTSNNAFVFPLWLQPDNAGQHGQLFGDTARLNLGREFLRRFYSSIGSQPSEAHAALGDVAPEHIFNYIYAVLHSCRYRSRYEEFLKRDFPRIPLPGGNSLFRALATLGGELVTLHLFESKSIDAFKTTYVGPRNPEVGRVGFCDDTVWLNAEATKKGQHAAAGTIGFHGVPEAVWSFHVGGYQVCEKWLKDRKGRKLSRDDVDHYQRIVVALSGTIRIMREIDEVIEKHGGWPQAFQTGDPAQSRL